MSSAYRAIGYLIDIGPVIIIPSVLFLIGLFSTRNILRNLKNCVFVFLGMLGVTLLITMFVNFFEPLVNTILINSLKEYEIIDAGWMITEIISFNSPIVIYIITAVFGLNIIMLLLRFTRTINIDLWGYWSFLLAGSIIFTITGIEWIGILISVIVAAITFVLADIYAHHIETYYGIGGISNTQAHIICWAPFSHIISIVLNKIPFVKRVHLFYDELRYRLGIFSEPMIVGFIMGFIIGIITRFRTLSLNLGPDLLFAFLSGLRLSIIMILLPRAVNLLMKGLVPAVNDIRSLIRRRFTQRTIYIGLDSIVLVGHPSVIGLSVIIIPLTVYISTILPGSQVLPSADLVLIPFLVIWAVTISQGDLFRSFISSILIVPLVLWIATDMGQVFTNFLIKYEFALVEGYSEVSSIGAGSNIFFWILLQIIKPIINLFV
jgi:PTS system galactitol-specific IIC component